MYRFLEGEDNAPMPPLWWLSRLSEEFHCRASEALEEWERAPVGLLEQIIEMRAFAAAKSIVDQARDRKDIPRTPMCQLVQRIEFERVQAEREAKAVEEPDA